MRRIATHLFLTLLLAATTRAQDVPPPSPSPPPPAPETPPAAPAPAAPTPAPPAAPSAEPTPPPTEPVAAPTPAPPPAVAPVPSPSQPVEIREALVIGAVARSRRAPVRIDAIQSAIVRGDFEPPAEGASITLPDGSSRTWTRAVAGEDGFLRDEALRGGYAFVRIESDRERPMLLDATRHSLVYVNGVPRTGDPYQYGNTRLPILLQQGANDLLFAAHGGVLRATLQPLPEPAQPWLDLHDLTAPDLLVGEPIDTVVGVLVVNPDRTPLSRGAIRATVAGGEATVSPVPPVPPLGIHKVAVRLKGAAPTEPGAIAISLSLEIPVQGKEAVHAVSSRSFELRAVDDATMRRITFVSSIDGSVQYYALQPANPAADATTRPGLMLTLHGASVEATNQAAAYRRKPWAHIVAPTNRRPYGFDWEDWGRLDAIEVLELAQRRFDTDPRRQWVTGHSMGGHGAWQLAVQYPDRFAVSGPSAGWIQFPPFLTEAESSTPMGSLLMRAALASQTLRLKENLKRLGVYILHGDADDNVSVSNARTMRGELGQFHTDFAYHERPGAGHWWGAECVDWPAMMDFMRRRTLAPSAQRSPLTFVTASPAVSPRCDWALIDAQQVAFEPSRIELSRHAESRRVGGTTANVARLMIDLAAAGLQADGPITVELDGATIGDIPRPADGRLWLERDGNGWRAAVEPGPELKRHQRMGPFKDAFRNRVLLVHGTIGTAEENERSLRKARFDSETFWYRGNGAMELMPDSAFDPAAHPDRNIVIYGNAETNSAWSKLLGGSPVQVRRGTAQIGSRTLEGEDLCVLLVRPRPDSAVASVAAIAPTGAVGHRLSERLPYFESGVAYPDVTVIGADALDRGIDGIRAAGFFGNDWSVERGEFIFAPDPPAAAPAPDPSPAPDASVTGQPTASTPSPRGE